MARIKAPVVVTANRLGSGEVVYLSRDGRWQASMDAGQVFTRARRGRGCAGAS